MARMPEKSYSVQLTEDQVAFLREALTYSAKAFRDASYEGQDPEWIRRQRREKDEMISSVREALNDAKNSQRT